MLHLRHRIASTGATAVGHATEPQPLRARLFTCTWTASSSPAQVECRQCSPTAALTTQFGAVGFDSVATPRLTGVPRLTSTTDGYVVADVPLGLEALVHDSHIIGFDRIADDVDRIIP
jgi:hypothetical protein